jgi:flagellar hook protein FlgE
MSTVELAQQFIDVAVTQRGFHAKARITTTSDELLQELINLQR